VKLSSLMLVNAIVFITFGIAFALYGPLMIDFFGILDVPNSSGGMYWYVASFARMFGAALFGSGFLIWAVIGFIDDDRTDPQARTRLTLALLITNLMVLFVASIQQITIWGRAIGWLTVVVFLAFLLAYMYTYINSHRRF